MRPGRALAGFAGFAGLAGLAGVALLAALAAAPAPAASAQTDIGEEHIASYDVGIDIRADSSLLVTEHIRYDFGFTPRHGIFRDIPVRFDYEPDSRYERLTTIDQVHVEAAPSGTSAKLDIEPEGREKRFRIGDPKKTITGVHDYTISYRVRGAMDAYPDHDELKWNAVGNGWEVPIDAVTVNVQTPGAVTQVACFAGLVGSNLPCGSATAGGGPGASFSNGQLDSEEAVTVVVGLPKGEVTVSPPILDERFSFARAYSLSPATGVATGGLLVVVVLSLFGLLRRGRDRRYVGSPVDTAMGNVSGQDERVPLLAREHDPVEFEPPDGIRPGQVGTLVDESADPLDVSATIVDLAVRGYLRIEEIPKHGWHGKADWNLVKLKSDDGLLAYEAKLHDGIFRDGDEVKLSGLKTHFAARLHAVENALYDDAVARKWFPTRPDKVRVRWSLLGVLALVVALVVEIVLLAATHAALVGLPLVFGALVLLLGAHRAPHRTAKGYAVLRRVNGFRQFIEESEKERARFAERANLFSEYLPYAVVFGATEKWAHAFRGLDDQVAASTSGWYVSPNPFLIASFADSMHGFAVTTSGTIVASAPSSSSGFGGGGFSGGGFGGGGGGSW